MPLKGSSHWHHNYLEQSSLTLKTVHIRGEMGPLRAFHRRSDPSKRDRGRLAAKANHDESHRTLCASWRQSTYFFLFDRLGIEKNLFHRHGYADWCIQRRSKSQPSFLKLLEHSLHTPLVVSGCGFLPTKSWCAGVAMDKMADWK